MQQPVPPRRVELSKAASVPLKAQAVRSHPRPMARALPLPLLCAMVFRYQLTSPHAKVKVTVLI
jgi:hypothetical protein